MNILHKGKIYTNDLLKRCGFPADTSRLSSVEKIYFLGNYLVDALEKLEQVNAPNKPLTREQFNAIYSTRENHVWPYDAEPPMLFLESAIEELDFCWISWSIAANLLASGYRAYSADNYGQKWRCWRSKPTDEERKAAPWEV